MVHDRDRVLRDVNGSISDPHHLQNHVYLANGIHLKKNHHMHKQHNPIFADKSLLRDLVVLQRSRTLRDPSEKYDLVNGRHSIALNGGESIQRNDAVCYGDEQPTSEPSDDDDVAVSCNKNDQRRVGTGKIDRESGANVRNRGKRRTFRRNIPSSGHEKNQNDVSVASNSFAQMYSYREDASHEYDDLNANAVKINGCGMPWNCSKIHDGGNPNLDKAGKDLLCGLSESRRLKKAIFMSQKREISDMRVMSEYSSSSTRSNSPEVLPLLLDFDSQMDITDNLLNRNVDFDFISEDKSLNNEGHISFTRKYMPRTFKDLIGQNLVAQSLSNAVSRGKIGSLYVFYGPQGTGKTSCARIFARALNCRSRTGSKPCGFCDSCIAQDRGNSHSVREIIRVSSNLVLENIVHLFDAVDPSRHQSRYKILIFDECDALTRDDWSTLVKVIDRAPRRAVFILICSSLNALPRVIISRSHKFFFSKIRNADILRILQFIATKEDIEIDEDALKLIALISNGSLRDAEMTLDQLSLLGHKISPPLVRELAGLASDEKLIDLLDLALSADTVNTVKSLREMSESGVEPLALTSQLATVITDILAGNFDVINNIETSRRKFFRRQVLTKHDMENLRRALKTLSEAEKQLRVSNDKMTWLTIAILQLASDSKHSPDLVLKNNDPINKDAYRDNNDKLTRVKSPDSEIIELEASSQRDRKSCVREASRSIPCRDVRKPDERDDRNLSLVKAKVPLAQVIRLVEGYSRNGVWSNLRSVSIAEKLEKDSLRLESRSRRLLCWNPPRRTYRKHSSRLKIRTRRPRTLLRFISCGKCLSVGSCK